jgi:DNA methylase
MLQCSETPLCAASAKHTVDPADALRRPAFLDVSSLNFGGAHKHRRFLSLLPLTVKCAFMHGTASTCSWRDAGFRPVGHIVFRKRNASAERFLRCEHEVAYLLAKGDVRPPAQPVPKVIEFRYTGNKLHPTQKPTAALAPLISSFCPAGGVVLDPFAGSGSILLAAKQVGRRLIGFEIDTQHHWTATTRLADSQAAA